jgi:hypothetical protein
MLTATSPSTLPATPRTRAVTPSPSFPAPSTDSRDLEKFGAAAGAPPAAAAAAPAPAPATSSTSQHSFSLHADAHLLTGSAAEGSQPHPHEEELKESSGSPKKKKFPKTNSEKNKTCPPSSSAAFEAQFAKMVSEAKSTAAASIAAPGAIDLQIHCLIVNEGHASVKAGRHAESLKEAFRIAQSRELPRNDRMRALVAHVQSWLPSSPIASAYVTGKVSRLHINFPTHDDLATAMLRHAFLVRCGCLHASSWVDTNSTPCGVSKHKQPELLCLSCPPVAGAVVTSSDIVQLLTGDMKLEFAVYWLPMTARKDQFAIYVLPRIVRLPALREEVKRLHNTYKLRGLNVSVSLVHDVKPQPCSQCKQLGHAEKNCPLYSGTAIRLLSSKFKFTFQAMEALVLRTQARSAFLGSNADSIAPSHRLTLLFDAEALMTEAAQKAAALQLVMNQMSPSLALQLQEAPRGVNVNDRFKECPECGSLQSPHECPFSKGYVARPVEKTGKAAQLAAAAKKPSEPSLALDKMCRSWRKAKRCMRHNEGACRFDHPDVHVAEQLCFQFQRQGTCHLEDCTFRHEAAEGSAKNNSVILASSSPPPPSHPPQQQAASASAAAAPAADSEAAPGPAAPDSAAASASAAQPAAAAKAASAPKSAASSAPPKRSSTASEKARHTNPFQALQSEESTGVDNEQLESPSTPRKGRSLTAAAPPASSPTRKRRQDPEPDEEEDTYGSGSGSTAAAAAPPVSSLSLIKLSSPAPKNLTTKPVRTASSPQAGSSLTPPGLDRRQAKVRKILKI